MISGACSLQCQLSSATWCCYVCVVTVHVQMFRNYKFVMLNMIVFARVLPPRSGWLQIQSSAHCEVLHHSQWEDRQIESTSAVVFHPHRTLASTICVNTVTLLCSNFIVVLDDAANVDGAQLSSIHYTTPVHYNDLLTVYRHSLQRTI